ncbi:MAG: hypothetical protein WBE61_04840 [Nitrososphaeraceae archaeon]
MLENSTNIIDAVTTVGNATTTILSVIAFNSQIFYQYCSMTGDIPP